MSNVAPAHVTGTPVVSDPVVPTAKPPAKSPLRIVAPIVVLGLVIALWYIISYGFMNANRRRVALPPPHTVWSDGVANTASLHKAWNALMVTGRIALIGLIISAVLGVLIAVAMNAAKWAEWAIYPYAVIVQVTPILALVPIIKIWFGPGESSRILVVILIAIFPIITNTLFGLQSTERAHQDLFTLHQASWWTRLWKLQLPSSLPAMFTGLRIAAGASVIGAIVGDFFFQQGSRGIGLLIFNLQKDVRQAELIVAALLSSLFGIVIFVVFSVVGNRILRSWHESARTDT